MVFKTRQKDININGTAVNQLGSGENPPYESEFILDTTFLEPSRQDNDCEVLSQRVVDKIKSGLVGTLELFENKLSSAINEIKVVVSSSIAESLKTKSNGGSEDGPGCSGMYVPVEESATENKYCRTNLALSRDNLTEFECNSDRAILETPSPERDVPITEQKKYSEEEGLQGGEGDEREGKASGVTSSFADSKSVVDEGATSMGGGELQDNDYHQGRKSKKKKRKKKKKKSSDLDHIEEVEDGALEVGEEGKDPPPTSEGGAPQGDYEPVEDGEIVEGKGEEEPADSGDGRKKSKKSKKSTKKSKKKAGDDEELQMVGEDDVMEEEDEKNDERAKAKKQRRRDRWDKVRWKLMMTLVFLICILILIIVLVVIH